MHRCVLENICVIPPRTPQQPIGTWPLTEMVTYLFDDYGLRKQGQQPDTPLMHVEAEPILLKAGSGLPEAGSGLPKAGSGLPEAGSDLLEAESGLLKSGSGILEAGSGILEAGSGFLEAASGLL